MMSHTVMSTQMLKKGKDPCKHSYEQSCEGIKLCLNGIILNICIHVILPVVKLSC